MQAKPIPALLSALEVYPNPASHFLTISAATKMKGTIRVMNVLGEILADQPVNAYEVDIDVATFPPRLYVVVLKSGEETVAGKFVKQ
ncbi:MAG TPA: T9SS type A sorting domain-containing protein [Chitinophagales bacterium]|nr:T9SS type A sorting domain-containing protein [Chitinophagales bacterium]